MEFCNNIEGERVQNFLLPYHSKTYNERVHVHIMHFKFIKLFATLKEYDKKSLTKMKLKIKNTL
jgi:hypothetical protein